MHVGHEAQRAVGSHYSHFLHGRTPCAQSFGRLLLSYQAWLAGASRGLAPRGEPCTHFAGNVLLTVQPLGETCSKHVSIYLIARWNIIKHANADTRDPLIFKKHDTCCMCSFVHRFCMMPLVPICCCRHAHGTSLYV